MNGNLLGKRFIFSVIMGVCVSVVTIILKYPDKTYVELVGIIVGVFTIAQSITDIKEKGNGQPPK